MVKYIRGMRPRHANIVADWGEKYNSLSQLSPKYKDASGIAYQMQGYGPTQMRYLEDKSGVLGAMTVKDDPQSQAIYVDNILKSPEIDRKDIGKHLLANAVQESINKGYQGRLKLTPIEGTRDYYQKMGFIPDTDEYEYILPSDRALALLNKYLKTA